MELVELVVVVELVELAAANWREGGAAAAAAQPARFDHAAGPPPRPAAALRPNTPTMPLIGLAVAGQVSAVFASLVDGTG